MIMLLALLFIGLYSSYVLCIAVTQIGTGNPTAVLSDGTVLMGSCDDNLAVNSFKGVRYAQPPLGKLRWTPPQPFMYGSDHEVVDATKFGPHCLQSTWPNGSEDCLFLNIYVGQNTTYSADFPGVPVVIFFHGGSYVEGASKFYSGADLVSYWGGDIIVVTADYRLNVFGFLGSEELRSRDSEAGSTGNYGIQDQRMAMKWVRDNIAAFGGDPAHVTIHGESAGAGSLSNHLTRPASWGLFGAAILESGAFSHWVCQPMARAQSVYLQLLSATNCDTASKEGTDMTAVIDCLQQMPADELFAASRSFKLPDGNYYLEPYLPVADGVETSTHPWFALMDKHLNATTTVAEDIGSRARARARVDAGATAVADVPVLLGSNSDEGIAMFTTDIVSKRTNMSELLQFWREDRGYTEPEVIKLLQLYVQGKNKNKGDEANGGYPESHIPFITTTEWWAAERSTGDVMFSCPVKHTSQQLATLYESGVRKSPIYTYHFAKHSFGSSYSIHGSEMQYVFHWRIGQKDDALLADTIASYWGNFIRSSVHNPNGQYARNTGNSSDSSSRSASSDNKRSVGGADLPLWEPYNTVKDNLLLFPNQPKDDTSTNKTIAQVKTGLKEDECAFFIPYLAATITKDFYHQ